VIDFTKNETEMKSSKYSGAQVVQLRALLVLVSIAVLCLFFSCGRSTTSTSGVEKRAAAVYHHSLQGNLKAILADIDAYQPPKEVDRDLFCRLRDELKRQLIAQADSKQTSVAPHLLDDKVTDLKAEADGDETTATHATLTWTEKLLGDYNNDGYVYITDLQPIAKYEGHSILEWIDGGKNRIVDGDGTANIDVNDKIKIADNYESQLWGYQVYRGDWNRTSFDWDRTIRANNDDPQANLGPQGRAVCYNST
jgi:hypothetical protein